MFSAQFRAKCIFWVVHAYHMQVFIRSVAFSFEIIPRLASFDFVTSLDSRSW